MKKIKKKLAGVILTTALVLTSISNVSAAQHGSYYTTIAGKTTTKIVPATTANKNYTWAMNYIYSLTGGEITSTHYRYYDSSTVKVAGTGITLSGVTNGGALWRPSSISTNPVYFYVKAANKCTGDGTNSTNCALQGAQYQLILKNNSSSTATIDAQYTLTTY